MKDILLKKNDIFVIVLNMFVSEGFSVVLFFVFLKGSREDRKFLVCEDGWLRIRICFFFLMIL